MISRYVKTAIYSGVIISVVNGLILGLSRIFQIKIAVKMNNEEHERAVDWIQIIPESFVMPIIAILLFIILKKLSGKIFFKIFVIITVIITAVWSIGPIQHGINTYSSVMLTITHVVIMSVIIIISRIILVKHENACDSYVSLNVNNPAP